MIPINACKETNKKGLSWSLLDNSLHDCPEKSSLLEFDEVMLVLPENQ